MSLLKQETMERMKKERKFEQLEERELLLVNGGLGCSYGSEFQPASTSGSAANREVGMAIVYSSIMAGLLGSSGVNCAWW